MNPFEKGTLCQGASVTTMMKNMYRLLKRLLNEDFPEGEYLIHGSAEFYTKDPAGAINKETYKMNADIGFTVTKGVNNK